MSLAEVADVCPWQLVLCAWATVSGRKLLASLATTSTWIQLVTKTNQCVPSQVIELVSACGCHAGLSPVAKVVFVALVEEAPLQTLCMQLRGINFVLLIALHFEHWKANSLIRLSYALVGVWMWNAIGSTLCWPCSLMYATLYWQGCMSCQERGSTDNLEAACHARGGFPVHKLCL